MSTVPSICSSKDVYLNILVDSAKSMTCFSAFLVHKCHNFGHIGVKSLPFIDRKPRSNIWLEFCFSRALRVLQNIKIRFMGDAAYCTVSDILQGGPRTSLGIFSILWNFLFIWPPMHKIRPVFMTLITIWDTFQSWWQHCEPIKRCNDRWQGLV